MEVLMVRIRVKRQHLDDYLREMIADAEGSVLNEPGCRRFDIIQDEAEPTKLGLCEVYDNEAAVQDHLSRPHFLKWKAATAGWTSQAIEVSACVPVSSAGEGHWDSVRTSAAGGEAFQKGLFIIHARLLVADDRVGDFIEASRLDATGAVNEEPGCLRFDLFQNKNDPTELYLYEAYVNKDAFEYHKRTPHLQRWAETVRDGFSLPESPDFIKGANVWPPDNWHWRPGPEMQR